jgi:glycosyltransferase involved in cell wall biosynthesis
LSRPTLPTCLPRKEGAPLESCPLAAEPITTVSVLMPTYNECATLPEVIRRVLAAPLELNIELIVVDDGSTDGSDVLLQNLAAGEPRMKALTHPHNRGKGAAVRTALAQATGQVVVIQDADLEYDPADYPALLAPLLAGHAEAVFGSRFSAGTQSTTGFMPRLANRVLTRMSNRLTGLALSDMETGMKAVRIDILKSLRLTSETFSIEPEITCELARSGARIREVPVHYVGRSYAAGKKIRARDFFKALAMQLRCRFRRGDRR